MPQGKRGVQDGGKGVPAASRAGGEMAIAARATVPPEQEPPCQALPWDPQAMPVAAGEGPATAPLAAFQEDDRRWFAAHPGRHHRVRPFDPAEAPPDHPVPARPRGWRNFTVVRQVMPGQRIRVVFAAEGEPSTGEHAAGRLFEICLRSLGGKLG